MDEIKNETEIREENDKVTEELVEGDALRDEMLSVDKTEKKIRHVSMKKTLILAGIAAVLIVAVLACYLLFGKKPETTDRNVKVLYEHQESEINKITIDNHLTSDRMVILPKQNGTTLEWCIEGQQYDDVDQNKIYYIGLFASTLKSMYVLPKDEKKFAEYGLDQPASEVFIEYEGGETASFKIGNIYGSDEGAYLLFDGADEIYIVNIFAYNYFTIPMADLMKLPSLTRTSTGAQVIYWFDKDRNLTQMAYIPGPLSGVEAYYLLEPTFCETDSESVDAFWEAIGNVALSAFYQAEAGEDLSVFGFDRPNYEMQSYTADEKLLDHFVVGKLVEGYTDTYYCALLGDGQEFATSPVYLVKESVLAPLRVNAADLANPYLVSLNIYWLRHGRFTIGGQDYEITVDRKLRYDDDGKVVVDEDGMEVTENTYYINGKQLDELQFKTFYSKMLFLTIEGITPLDTEKGEEIFTYSLEVVIPVTSEITGVSSRKEAVYEGTYYKINDNYAVFKNNESENAAFTVRIRSIDAIEEALNLLLEGRMPVA